MGVSTDGILCYGIEFEEEENPLGDEDIGLGEYLAAKQGVQNPWNDVDENITYEQHVEKEEADPAYAKRFEDYRNLTRKLEEEAPIQIVSHCSCDYPMYIIALKGTVTEASRGYPEHLGTEIKYPGVEAIAKASQFCKTQGWPSWDNDGVTPNWLLCSIWC